MSDIDTAMVECLKALDPNRPIREADKRGCGRFVCFVPCVNGSELALHPPHRHLSPAAHSPTETPPAVTMMTLVAVMVIIAGVVSRRERRDCGFPRRVGGLKA